MIFYLSDVVGNDFHSMGLMDLFKSKLKPVKLELISSEQMPGMYIRYTIKVRFRMGWDFTRGWYFYTYGTFEAAETIDHETLMRILKTTDLQTYVALNMQKRERGNFDYQYSHNGNLLVVNFETF